MSINRREPRPHSEYRFNYRTGRRELVTFQAMTLVPHDIVLDTSFHNTILLKLGTVDPLNSIKYATNLQSVLALDVSLSVGGSEPGAMRHAQLTRLHVHTGTASKTQQYESSSSRVYSEKHTLFESRHLHTTETSTGGGGLRILNVNLWNFNAWRQRRALVMEEIRLAQPDVCSHG